MLKRVYRGYHSGNEQKVDRAFQDQISLILSFTFYSLQEKHSDDMKWKNLIQTMY